MKIIPSYNLYVCNVYFVHSFIPNVGTNLLKYPAGPIN